jgi:hypothetical protein
LDGVSCHVQCCADISRRLGDLFADQLYGIGCDNLGANPTFQNVLEFGLRVTSELERLMEL